MSFERPGSVDIGKKTNGARLGAKPSPAHAVVPGADCDSAGRGRRIAARTLGPVSDLKRHLPLDWWRTLFDSFYLETDDPNPDRCWDGKLNLMAQMAGLRYSDLLKLIIGAAQDRVAMHDPGLVIPFAERQNQRFAARGRGSHRPFLRGCHQTVIPANLPLRSRLISVSIGLSTHSHVPMAHGGYATT